MYTISSQAKFKCHSWIEAVLVLIFKQIVRMNFLEGNYIHILSDRHFPLQTSGPCVHCVLHDHKLNRNWLNLWLRSCICCSAYITACRTYTAVLSQSVDRDCIRKQTRLHDEVHEVPLNISTLDSELREDPICRVYRRNIVGNYHINNWISDQEVWSLDPWVLHTDPILLPMKCSSSRERWKQPAGDYWKCCPLLQFQDGSLPTNPTRSWSGFVSYRWRSSCLTSCHRGESCDTATLRASKPNGSCVAAENCIQHSSKCSSVRNSKQRTQKFKNKFKKATGHKEKQLRETERQREGGAAKLTTD